MDPEVVKQLNTQHGRAIGAASDFSVNNSQLMAQLGSVIASSTAFDNRLMNGFLASQLFNQQLVEAKSAFHSPVEPSAAALATPVTTK